MASRNPKTRWRNNIVYMSPEAEQINLGSDGPIRNIELRPRSPSKTEKGDNNESRLHLITEQLRERCKLYYSEGDIQTVLDLGFEKCSTMILLLKEAGVTFVAISGFCKVESTTGKGKKSLSKDALSDKYSKIKAAIVALEGNHYDMIQSWTVRPITYENGRKK
jgi:hypothetical protein